MTIVLDGSSGITAPGGTAAAPSITTTGDVNTGIFFPAADTIAFTEGGAESMRIDSSGNVGIGTASPTGKLHVSGYAGGVGLRLTRDISTDILDFYQGGGVSYIDSSIAGGQLAFATAGTERMRLTSTGLGIGTTSPSYRLDVVGSTGFQARLGSATTNFGIFINDAGNFVSCGSITNDDFNLFTNGVDRATITAAGEFLVGTTSVISSAKVTISANSSSLTDASYLTLYGVGENIGDINYTNAFGIMARLRGTKAGSGGGADEGYFEVKTASNGTLTGGVYVTSGGTSWVAVSDEQKKTDLVPIEQACAKVLTLRAVTGRYLDDKPERRRAFLIAQDVQAVLPEAVFESTNNDESVLGLAYTDTIPLLVAAIKELSAKVAALEGNN